MTDRDDTPDGEHDVEVDELFGAVEQPADQGFAPVDMPPVSPADIDRLTGIEDPDVPESEWLRFLGEPDDN